MKEFRIPMVGAYNTRIAAANVLSGPASGYIGTGVIGTFIIGAGTTSTEKDARFLNCFTTTVADPMSGKKKLYLVKRPGFGTQSTPSAGQVGVSLLVWTGQGTGGKVISAFNSTNSTIYDGTTSLGAITGKSTGITETVVGTEATLTISSNDNTAWHTSSSAVTGAVTFTADTHTNTTLDNISSITGLVVGQLLTGTGFAANTRIASIDSATAATLTTATTATNAGVTVTRTVLGKIVDADFPGNASKTLAGTFAHMDGFACIMDTAGNLWASELNTTSTWVATSFGATNAYPDKGIGCIRHKNFIMAFGSESVEFFYNAGLTPFPFAKSVAMTVKVGAVSAEAITQISDTVFWCGSTPQGGVSIFQYDGSIGRVSTPEIDAALILAGVSNISLTPLRFYGRSFIVVIAGTTTYVYCIEEKEWFQFHSQTILWHKCTGVSMGGTMVNYAISTTSTSGKVYLQNHAALVFTDDTFAYTARAQLANNDHGTARLKFYSDIELIADIEASSSPITLGYTDDDYQTYTTYGDLDLSTARPRATRLGSSKKRGWVLTHSAATPFRIEAMEGHIEVGQ